MFYVICYPKLVRHDSEWIESFRRIHEPGRAGLVHAHVTLVFGVCAIEISALTSLATEIASREVAFDLEFDAIEVHEDYERADHKLFLVAHEGGEQLARMHKQFYSGVLRSELRADISFEAHMTLATASSVDLIYEARQEAQTLRLPVLGAIDAIDVVALVDGKLNEVSHIRLGSGMAPS
jgi:hypothetical protein